MPRWMLLWTAFLLVACGTASQDRPVGGDGGAASPGPVAAAREPVVVPRPGSPEWLRYALIVGLSRLAESSSLAPSPDQARRLLVHLEGLQEADHNNDRLHAALQAVFTESQQAYVGRHVKRPEGTCPCPCSTWNPVLRSTLRLSRTRAGLEAGEEAPVEEGAQALAAVGDELGILVLLQGILQLEKEPGLAVTPDQARRLVAILEDLAESVGRVQGHMQALEAGLEADQKAYIRKEGSAWFADLTAAELDRHWEEWLDQAVESMAGIAYGASRTQRKPM